MEYASLRIPREPVMKRREFAKTLGAAPVLAANWISSSIHKQQTETKSTNAPTSRAEELRIKAQTQREQLSAALRKKALPYDLEPAFVFAAQPSAASRRRGQNDAHAGKD